MMNGGQRAFFLTTGCGYNEIYDNTMLAFSQNSIYISGTGTTGNIIYNNFINTTPDVGIGTNGINNYFNTTNTSAFNIMGGPSIGGNYYATPAGDGFSQTCNDVDVDGFCDDNNTFALVNNVDQLPLSTYDLDIYCTPPAIDNNWEVPFEANCVLLNYTDLGTGDLILGGREGTFTLKASLEVSGYSSTCNKAPCSFIYYPTFILTP